MSEPALTEKIVAPIEVEDEFDGLVYGITFRPGPRATAVLLFVHHAHEVIPMSHLHPDLLRGMRAYCEEHLAWLAQVAEQDAYERHYDL